MNAEVAGQSAIISSSSGIICRSILIIVRLFHSLSLEELLKAKGEGDGDGDGRVPYHSFGETVVKQECIICFLREIYRHCRTPKIHNLPFVVFSASAAQQHNIVVIDIIIVGGNIIVNKIINK